MIFEASEFVFKAPPAISRAQRVLIKPTANYPVPYPVTTSREMLASIIEGIREVSDADILILEGTPTGAPVRPIYEALNYDFPRVLMPDVKDCIWVEVDNPLPKPLAVPTFWVPNVILSSDYLISVAPLKVINGQANLSIVNLLSALPISKYAGGDKPWGALYTLGLEKVIADLYFTLPFDLGIIEARQEFVCHEDNPAEGKVAECGKILVGEPYEVDTEAAEMLGLRADYLDLIKLARVELES